MWLVTVEGFYSIVEDFADPNRLFVRARVKADLLRLPGVRKEHIIATPNNDYPFRVHITRKQADRIIRVLVKRIKYPNFKDAVKKKRGAERANIYTRVWADLQALNPKHWLNYLSTPDPVVKTLSHSLPIQRASNVDEDEARARGWYTIENGVRIK